ncbi:hypothetical protein [Pandoraea cepalis]|nr:hypothetical protein [Pandoraea cepalis]
MPEVALADVRKIMIWDANRLICQHWVCTIVLPYDLWRAGNSLSMFWELKSDMDARKGGETQKAMEKAQQWIWRLPREGTTRGGLGEAAGGIAKAIPGYFGLRKARGA